MADCSVELTSPVRCGPCGTRTAGVRLLTPGELSGLRRDMAESSAWAKAELKRRRAAKNPKNLNMV